MIKVKIVNLSYQGNSNFLYNICRINREEFEFHDFNYNRSGCKNELIPCKSPSPFLFEKSVSSWLGIK